VNITAVYFCTAALHTPLMVHSLAPMLLLDYKLIRSQRSAPLMLALKVGSLALRSEQTKPKGKVGLLRVSISLTALAFTHSTMHGCAGLSLAAPTGECLQNQTAQSQSELVLTPGSFQSGPPPNVCNEPSATSCTERTPPTAQQQLCYTWSQCHAPLV
jgi:hypothetical protein